MNSAPIMFFLFLEQGPQFTAHAAIGCLVGIVAWAAFSLVYAWCCLRLKWWWSTLIGWAVFSLLAWALIPVSLGPIWSYVLVCATLAAIILAFPRIDGPIPLLVHTRSELWLRMASASAMIVTLTALARTLGPMASGILSAFPAYTTILAVFNHRHQPQAAVSVLKGVSVGLYTAATFFLVFASTLVRFGMVRSFAMAGAAALVVQGGSFFFVRRN